MFEGAADWMVYDVNMASCSIRRDVRSDHGNDWTEERRGRQR